MGAGGERGEGEGAPLAYLGSLPSPRSPPAPMTKRMVVSEVKITCAKVEEKMAARRYLWRGCPQLSSYGALFSK